MPSRNQRLQKDLIEWRKTQELQLLATGHTMPEVAEELKVSVATVSKDLKKMREESRIKQAEYIESLPFEHTKSVASINKAHDELWSLYRSETDRKQKRAILEAIGEIIVKRQILLGDPQHIDRALKAVARIKRQLADQVAEDETEQDTMQEQQAAPVAEATDEGREPSQ